MILFGLALGLLEWSFFGLLFLLLVIGCTVDRRYDRESFKWWVVLGGLAFATFWYWKKDLFPTSFGGVLDTLMTFSFWKPALVYFGIGVVYSCVEFLVDVSRAKKFYAAEWSNHLDSLLKNTTAASASRGYRDENIAHGDLKVKDLLTHAKTTAEDDLKAIVEQTKAAYSAVIEGEASVKREAKDAYEAAEAALATSLSKSKAASAAIESFVTSYKTRNRVVQLERDALNILPKINKLELSEHVAAWTIFWPAYLISTVLGDLLTHIWDAIAEFLTTFAGKYVKSVFKDAFSF